MIFFHHELQWDMDNCLLYKSMKHKDLRVITRIFVIALFSVGAIHVFIVIFVIVFHLINHVQQWRTATRHMFIIM